ncbi:MAG: DNA recombination protein RmuC [Planctomycetes bacterium]|nr:DNA recombination protein RmuC [Planctomycetota bacterium]MBU1518509.1 DNA recombination protein RmuC [Planctomycetota bacterium]
MTEALIVILIVAVLAVIVALLWLTIRSQLEGIKRAQENLSQSLQQSLISGQETVNKNLQFHSQTLEKVNNQLGQLQGSSQKIMELGGDIKSLQQILASPKLRGGLGEWSLENVLSALLPADSFALQYAFRDGKIVDALVKMPQYSVPIDAKFPLENFKKFQQSQNDADAKKLHREFLRDVQKHIDKISQSYIKPDEGTLDFAIMYIPAENVYYEAMVKTAEDTINIQDYAMGKKVFPVSPNLLYVYLMTIVMGLHGLQIEKQAAEIRQNLKALNVSFAEFGSLWDTLGGHLRHSYEKYDEGQKKLDKLVIRLEQIQNGEKQ